MRLTMTERQKKAYQRLVKKTGIRPWQEEFRNYPKKKEAK